METYALTYGNGSVNNTTIRATAEISVISTDNSNIDNTAGAFTDGKGGYFRVIILL